VPDSKSFAHVLWLAALLSLAIAGSAPADDLPTDESGMAVPSTAQPAAAAAGTAAGTEGGFRPPAEELAKSDWLRLNSGEWLMGNIEYMRDGDMEFESSELDSLVISFGDISEVHSPHPNRFLFENGDVLIGPSVVQGDTITILVDGQPTTRPRGEIEAILEGTQRERNYWSFGVGFGFTGRAGNTESVDLSASAYIKRETTRTRWNTEYLGAFASVSGDTNTNNHRVNSQFDYFLTPRLYLIPMRFDFYNDEFQNIDYRITPAAGLGYEVFQRKSITWDVIAAFGYQYTQFIDPDDTEGTFVTVLGTTFGADITKYLEFDFLYYVNLGIPDVNKTTHHSQATFSFDIWGPLDFDVDFIFDRQEDPPQSPTGGTIKNNDFRMVVGLGVDF